MRMLQRQPVLQWRWLGTSTDPRLGVLCIQAPPRNACQQCRLNRQTIFPMQTLTVVNVWISFITFRSREKSNAQALGEQSPPPFTTEAGPIRIFSCEQIFTEMLSRSHAGLVVPLGNEAFTARETAMETRSWWSPVSQRGHRNLLA